MTEQHTCCEIVWHKDWGVMSDDILKGIIFIVGALSIIHNTKEEAVRDALRESTRTAVPCRLVEIVEGEE